MNKAKSLPLKVAYEGSVKRVLESSVEPDKLWFQFTDDYSVFDWGKMPDTIKNKGRALTLMGAFFFEQLGRAELWQSLKTSTHLAKFDQKFLQNRYQHAVFKGAEGLSTRGLKTHFLSLTDDSGLSLTLEAAIKCSGNLLMQVKKAEVLKPQSHKVLGQNLFFYPVSQAHSQPNPEREKGASLRLIPLEIVFRFGMPGGSSLEERLGKDSSYAQSLGFEQMPQSNTWFAFPVIEFFTKLEPKDRFLPYQEAALLSGLTAESFETLTEIGLDVALALHDIFANQGMELWDGKIELLEAIDENGVSQIMLADSVGPDELRVLVKGHQLSKEMLRQYYRGSAWELAIKEAQIKAKERAVLDWKTICQTELKNSPATLPGDFKEQVDALYCVLTNTLMQRPVFAGLPSLDAFIEQTESVITKFSASSGSSESSGSSGSTCLTGSTGDSPGSRSAHKEASKQTSR